MADAGARPAARRPRRVWAVLEAAASLKVTVVLIGGLLVASFAIAVDTALAGGWVLALPLTALGLNLAAAVATNAVFRKQMPLLVFHLALIAILLLAAVGRMTVLHGRAAVTSGAAFGGLIERSGGPWHRGDPDTLEFVSEGFAIDYLPGPQTDRLRAFVRWRDDDGREQRAEVEPVRPLVLDGYRIAPTSNKGFAVVVAWGTAAGGAPLVAALHLPPYPGQAAQQSRDWEPEGATTPLWLQLEVPPDLIAADRRSQFRLPDNATLVVRAGDSRWELRPGDRIEVAGGVFEYVGLRSWMGYTFFHDWTIPWLLAACALAVASLGWHFWRKFAAVPWNREPEHGS